MRRTGLLWVALAAISIVTSGCSKQDDTKRPASDPVAARPAAVGTGGAGATLNNDSDFVRDVASKTRAELEFSRMALDKATSPDVKSFAQRTIEDDGATGDKLKNLVGTSIEWPAQFDDKHRKTAEDLAKRQGLDFDREYVEAMVEVHQDLAAKLESRLDVQSVADWKTAAAGRTYNKALPEPQTATRDVPVRPNKSDNDVTTKINQWAADTYPVAQKHLDTARTLENAVKKRSSN